MHEDTLIALLALLLLLIRLIAVRYFFRVLKTQRSLLKKPIAKDIDGFRKDLFVLTIIMVASSIPAIVLDVFFLFRGIGVAWLTVSSTLVLAIYTTSNAVSFLAASVLFDRLYRDSLRVDQTHPDSDHTLMNDETKGE